MEKHAFVKHFSIVVSMAIVDVERLRYRRDGQQEFVDVSFVDGSHKPVCVTADSNEAIMRDVLRALR